MICCYCGEPVIGGFCECEEEGQGGLNVLSLCSGVGGIELGLRLAWKPTRTVCYVEREAYAAACLVARMQDGLLDLAPVHSDLRAFDGRPWAGVVDLVTAGYPCQPFSVAGKQLGAADPRHLWPEVLRVLVESQAPVAFLENVRGHVKKGLQQVLKDLAGFGFDAEWDVFSAEEEGAPHRRERLFIFAFDRHAPGMFGPSIQWGQPDRASQRTSEPLAYAKRQGKPQQERGEPDERRRLGNGGWWRAEPDVGRVAHGVPSRVDRLRALGNGVVPAVAARAWTELTARAMEQEEGA
ncbi:MAG: DNA cytosine methyltransferase [bacterium]|nr:DNA cytosine methyltransferase [bacterium]